LDNKEKTYEEICKFVSKKPRRTINQIVTHIVHVKKLCAKQTAQNRVGDLIGNRLVDNRQGGPKGFHSIYINDENQFIQIDKELTDIENSMIMMDQPMDKIRKLRFHEFFIGSKEFSDMRDHFEMPYRNAFNFMLLVLLVKVDEKIHSENVMKILYRKIFELMIKLHLQTFYMVNTGDVFRSLIHELERVKGSSGLEAYAKKYDINIKIGSNLITKIKNFEKRFLD
jgi:hypothetical protein